MAMESRIQNKNPDPIRIRNGGVVRIRVGSGSSMFGSGFGSSRIRPGSDPLTGLSLTIRDGMVVLVRANPQDDYQHWYMDDKYGERVKDEAGLPSFALVNKATGLALRHATAATRLVQLTRYNPDAFDETILWTKSSVDDDAEYQEVWPVNNIHMNLDAFLEDRKHLLDGNMVGLWEWNGGENQNWRIAGYD